VCIILEWNMKKKFDDELYICAQLLLFNLKDYTAIQTYMYFKYRARFFKHIAS
jgi:hypothetical protein